jgi:tetratricopeptide (TPR) repeat protein
MKLPQLFPVLAFGLFLSPPSWAGSSEGDSAMTAMTSAEADDRVEAALARVNAVLRADPNNATAYLIRGNIYGTNELWDLAREDYEQALQVEPENPIAKVNLAELDFRQKKYDLARTSFVDLEANPQIGDLARYKVFLCDLFGAHETTAWRELEAFDGVGENASYYFGNVAWDLVHHQDGAARDFLASAEAIYAPKKVELYAASLMEAGYLPMPALSSVAVR